MTAKNSNMKKEKTRTVPGYRLVEGSVDPSKEHIGLTHGADDTIIARVAPGPDHTFIIQYLIAPDVVKGGKNLLKSCKGS